MICSGLKTKTLKAVDTHENMAGTLYNFIMSNFIGFHRAFWGFFSSSDPYLLFLLCNSVMLQGSCIIEMPEELLNDILYVWNCFKVFLLLICRHKKSVLRVQLFFFSIWEWMK